MERPRVLFMGTPAFAVTVLEALAAAGYPVVGAVSQPDRETGRKRVLTPPPVKAAAAAHGIPVLQPARIGTPDSLSACASLAPDVIVTAAYGQFLPQRLLSLPRFGAFNVHASLLPKYRGGAPVQHALLNGETATGVSVMTMVRAMDAGPVWAQEAVAIGPDDTSGGLLERLAAAGGGLLVRTLPGILSGALRPAPQDEAAATFAPTLARADECIDFAQDSRAVYNRIRALAPQPGGFARWGGADFKVWLASPLHDWRGGAAPGRCVAFAADGPVVACSRGALILTRVQPAGRRAVSGAEFVRTLRAPDAFALAPAAL